MIEANLTDAEASLKPYWYEDIIHKMPQSTTPYFANMATFLHAIHFIPENHAAKRAISRRYTSLSAGL